MIDIEIVDCNIHIYFKTKINFTEKLKCILFLNTFF